MTKRGFSLAEVLITLTVIGIAVALTMPMLKNYLSHRYITAARTTYYDVEKILRSIQSELGPYESWGYVDKEFADKYIDNRIAYVKKTNSIQDFYSEAGSYFVGTAYQLQNSSILIFANMSTYRPHLTYIIFDVNGVEGPNAIGVDIFSLYLNTSPVLDQEKFPYGISMGTTECRRTDFNQNTGYRPDGGGSNMPNCLKILVENNWTTKNYPVTNFGQR